MSEHVLHVGDLVNRDGVQHMVIRILPDGKVRVRKWPIVEAPPAEDVDASAVEFVERPGLAVTSTRGENE